MKHFGSIEKLSETSPEEISAVENFGDILANNIFTAFLAKSAEHITFGLGVDGFGGFFPIYFFKFF